MKKAVLCGLAFLWALGGIAQEEAPAIFFFGTRSNTGDETIIAMTDELFYTQLSRFSGYSIVDRRGTLFSENDADLPEGAVVFYAEIIRGEDSWECTLRAVVPGANRNIASTKKYSTYYRILTGAKESLGEVVKGLDGAAPEAWNPESGFAPTLSALAGNWADRGGAARAVLFRGGGGFVIFKNGAVMNVGVNIEDGQVIIRQTSGPNPQFYPDVPRDAALKAMESAPPVEWIFLPPSEDILTGAQYTLGVSGNGQDAARVEIPVVWQRQER